MNENGGPAPQSPEYLQATRDDLLRSIVALQVSQNESLRVLLNLRLEQFCIRYHQVTTLLGIIEDVGHCAAVDEFTYHRTR